MLNILLRIERSTTAFAHNAAALLFALAACLAFYQVLTRFLIGDPSTWSEVAARALMVWGVYLGIAAAFRQGAMIAVDLLHRFVHGRSALAVHGVVTLICLIFLAVLGWYGVAMAERVQNQALAGMQISIAWCYAALPVGAIFSMIALLARFAEMLREGPPARVDDLVDEPGGAV